MLFKKAPDKTKLYYYKCANVGDILNETLICDLFGIDVEECDFSSSDMIAIGSILERIVKGAIVGIKDKEIQAKADKSKIINVWGTGLMHAYDDYSKMEFVRPVKICAVRGELTRQAVEKITGKRVKCPTADPGILAPFMLDEIPEKKYTLGIIPHVVERDFDEYKAIQSSVDGSVIIDLTGEPKEVLRQIASCEAVISTSLHGLIIADAFGVPSRWCELTDKILGKGYKYRDYYSGFGIEEEPFDLRSGDFPTVEQIKSNYKIDFAEVRKKQKQIIKAFPYQNKKTKALYKSL